jgi:hypothetical protein
VPKKLVRRGRVRGYRPTREQLEEVFELAQRGIGQNSVAKLIYSQGNEEIYSEGNDGKILPENLGQVVRDAGDPGELNNLYFSINQDSPARRVEMEIGPGDWTTYSIESDDQTWAHGRYYEITESLLANRSLYAKGGFSAPEVPKEGTDGWRPAAWELVSDWRASAVGNVIHALWFALWSVVVVGILTILVALSYDYYNMYTNSEVARNDRHNAHLVLSWFQYNSTFLLIVILCYAMMARILSRRMKRLLESKVTLRGSGSSFLSQLAFQRNRNDAVQLAVLYLTFLILIVGIVALLPHV